MATEATKTRACLKRVKQHWPGCWIYKINDRSTAGIPDALLIHKGIAIFVEFKYARRNEVVSVLVRPLQQQTLQELDRVNDGGAIVVVFRGATEEVYWPYLLARTHHRDLLHYLEEEWNR
jgi:hypothetical protein